jgi:tight adherence protein C
MVEVSLSSLLVFFSVFIGLQTLLGGASSTSLRQRLSRMKSVQGLLAENDDEKDQSGILYGENSPLIKKLSPAVEANTGTSENEKSALRSRLVRAGFRRRDAPTLYQLIRMTGAVGPSVMAFFLSGLAGLDQMSGLGLASIVGILGFLLPSMALDNRAKSRVAGIEQNLPSAIDLLAVSIDAGMGIGPALERVGVEFKRLSPVFSEELRLVAMQSSAGRTSSDALRELSQRAGSQQLTILVNTLIQTERFGTNVSEALRSYSNDMRTLRIQAAEERAGRAATLMLLPTAMIMLSILIIILGLGAIKASSLLS